MKLTIRKSELDAWWVIERAEHDGREWFEATELGMSYQCSSRLSDADVEGNAEQMKEIAKAIRVRGKFRAKRCSVSYILSRDQFAFDSPRNSQEYGYCSVEEADALASEIEAKLGDTP